MLDLVSIGDVMIDHFFFVRDARVHCELKDHTCRIDLPYGTKIPVDQYIHTTAGNCANVAVGASRLGVHSALITIVGDDSGGREVLHKMQKEGVDVHGMIMDKKAETNISAVLSVHGERTILVHHVPRKYRTLRIPKAKIYYLTSAGPSASSLSTLHQQVLKMLPQKALLAFNPGTYQLELGITRLSPILRRTNILFVNKEEAQLLLHQKEQDVPLLVNAWRQWGIPTVVITDGANGAWAGNAQGMWHQPIIPLPDVERTGAGDAFACAVVCATLAGKPLAEALRWGAAESASVVSHIGPQTGLLNTPKLHQLLKKYSQIKPLKING